MTKKELDTWFKYLKAYKITQKNGNNAVDTMNGVYMEREDYQELIRLNHLVMELSHEIHNDNMMDLVKN